MSITGIVVLHFYTQSPNAVIKPHPVFFFTRLFLVIILQGILWMYTSHRRSHEIPLLRFGRESLLVYWLHLQIIYRHIWQGKSLEALIQHQFGLAECILASVILTVFMIVMANAWDTIKTANPALAKKVFRTIVIAGIITFVLPHY